MSQWKAFSFHFTLHSKIWVLQRKLAGTISMQLSTIDHQAGGALNTPVYHCTFAITCGTICTPLFKLHTAVYLGPWEQHGKHIFYCSKLQSCFQVNYWATCIIYCISMKILPRGMSRICLGKVWGEKPKPISNKLLEWYWHINLN